MACALPAAAADLCAGHITDRSARVVPAMDRPGYLTPYFDPAFGSRMLRISNAPAGRIVKTLYSTVQAWNLDETRLVLYHSGGADAGHHLYDGQTYAHLEQLPFSASDIEEVFWDPKRASTLYFVQRRPFGDQFQGKLVRYDINTRSKSVVADVSSACGTAGSGVIPTAGVDVQGISGDYVGLRCNLVDAKGSANDRTFTVNVRNGNIGPMKNIGPTDSIGGGTGGSLPNVSIAPLPSNNRFLIQGSVFDRSMNFQHRVDTRLQRNSSSRMVPRLEHDAVGRLSNGNDALFNPQFDAGPAGCKVGTLVGHDLQKRTCDVMIGPSTGWGYPLSGIHHSALTTATAGWIATSVVGYGQLQYLTNGKPAPTTFSEILLTSNNPDNPTTCRLAHTRTHGKSARRTARQAYFGEPHPIVSPSGTRVLFSSDWYDSGTVDTFVINVTAPSNGSGATFGVGGSGAAQTEVATTVPEVQAATPAATARQAVPGVSIEPGNRRYRADVGRIAVQFKDTTRGDYDRVTIAPAGSPDADVSMWLHTNGTQRQTATGPQSGWLQFLTRYLGTGDFEARLFRKNSNEIVAREAFRIGD